MLSEDALTIGIVPIMRDKINRVRNILTSKGTLSKHKSVETSTQCTIQSLVKSWARKHLQITDKDWEKIEFQELIQTGGEKSEIIFLKCANTEDAAFITSHTKNLPNEKTGQGPRLITHIDRKAKAHYQAFNTIAKSKREKSKFTIQTNIIIGQNDYLLRERPKGETTPWQHIAPTVINHRIPPFEIGMYNKIRSPETSSSEDQEAVGIYFDKTKLLQSELLFNSWSYVGIIGILLTKLKYSS